MNVSHFDQRVMVTAAPAKAQEKVAAAAPAKDLPPRPQHRRRGHRRHDDDSLTLSYDSYRDHHRDHWTYSQDSRYDDRYGSYITYSDYCSNMGISDIGPGICTEYLPGAEMQLPVKPMWKVGPTGKKMMMLPNPFWAAAAKAAAKNNNVR